MATRVAIAENYAYDLIIHLRADLTSAQAGGLNRVVKRAIFDALQHAGIPASVSLTNRLHP